MSNLISSATQIISAFSHTWMLFL